MSNQKLGPAKPGNASPGHNACPRGNNAKPMNKKLLHAHTAARPTNRAAPGETKPRPSASKRESRIRSCRGALVGGPLLLGSLLLLGGLPWRWCAELPDDSDDEALFFCLLLPHPSDSEKDPNLSSSSCCLSSSWGCGPAPLWYNGCPSEAHIMSQSITQLTTSPARPRGPRSSRTPAS